MMGEGTVLWTEDNFVFGQIWKFRFMYTCGIDQSFRVFYPTFDEWKSRFGAQSSQKRDIKKRKNEKMPKNSQFWACFGVFEQLNLVRLNSAVAVKLYFVHILQIKVVGKLKSHEIAWNQLFCDKNANFHQITKFFGEKCARNQTFHMKWNQNALKYCTLILISSLERKRSNIQFKIWNCPPHPLF